MKALFYRLTHLHTEIDGQIRYEMTGRSPDQFRLMRLKRLRLAIKDRLARVMVDRSALRPA